MARKLPNGALVDDSGEWYWDNKGWSPLVAAPSTKAPGSVLGKDRRDVGHLMHGIGLSDYPRVQKAGEDLKALVAETGSLQAAEIRLLESAPAAIQVTAAVEAGKMTPIQLSAIELVGGSPDFKPGTKVNLWMDNRTLELKSGFKTVRYPLAYISAGAETQQEIERRVTATRLLAVGIFAFAFKKQSVHAQQFLTVTCDDPNQSASLVFETDGAPKLAAKIQAAAIPLRQAAASASTAPAATTPGPEDISGKLKQLTEMRESGLITDEEFSAKRAELLARL